MLEKVEPALGELRLLFGPRAFRRSDPGPVLTLSAEDLARLIERRARFDPPQWPAPVGSDGYRVVMVNGRIPRDPLYAAVGLRAGVYSDARENSLDMEVNPNGIAWRDDNALQHIFAEIAAIWDAKWGAVWRQFPSGEEVAQTPRLAWTAEKLIARPVPPYLREHPPPLPFEGQPTRRETHPQLGGELELWL
jgi:hypothetical protein